MRARGPKASADNPIVDPESDARFAHLRAIRVWIDDHPGADPSKHVSVSYFGGAASSDRERRGALALAKKMAGSSAGQEGAVEVT